MELFWFLAGVLTTLATLLLLLPWLRTIPHLGSLPAVPWPVAAGAALMRRVGLRSVPLARTPGACESAGLAGGAKYFRRCGVGECAEVRGAVQIPAVPHRVPVP